MVTHPRLAVALIPFHELEILFKRYYDGQKQQKQTFDAFLATLIPEYRSKVTHMLEAECAHEETRTAEKFSGNIEIYRHKRYYPSAFHSHDFFEFFYMPDGVCKIEIPNKQIILKEEDICLIPPGMSHKISLYSDGILVSLLIKRDYFINSFNSFLTEHNLMSAFFTQGLYMKNENSYLLFHTYGDENIRRMLETILLEYITNKKYCYLLMDSFLSSALNFLLRDHIDRAEYETNILNQAPLIAEIQMYLQENIQTATLKSVAAHFNYSIAYLSRLIRMKANSSFSDMLKAERIRRACSLIANTNLSITKIAALIGYDSQRQFNRMFKAEIGCTPSDYRTQQNKKDDTEQTPPRNSEAAQNHSMDLSLSQ